MVSRLTHVLARVGTALLFADDEFTHTLVAGWLGSRLGLLRAGLQ